MIYIQKLFPFYQLHIKLIVLATSYANKILIALYRRLGHYEHPTVKD